MSAPGLTENLERLNRQGAALALTFARKSSAAKALELGGYTITIEGGACRKVGEMFDSYVTVTDAMLKSLLAEREKANAAQALAASFAVQLQNLEWEKKMTFRLFIMFGIIAIGVGVLIGLSSQ